MDISKPNTFLFAAKYRVWRHVLFWVAHTLFFSLVFLPLHDFPTLFFLTAVWIPVRMLYCYPLMYWALPSYLLKERYTPLMVTILLWIVAGWLLNYLFRAYLFIPLQDYIQLKSANRNPWQTGTYLSSVVTAGCACMIVLFKHWIKKQQEWLQAEKEKVTAELQLLKAQVHPHFLFNTLNNIYAFSLQRSPKTPELVLKLSALLSYILYECKGDEVLLEKELEIMKAYIDLEQERYGNQLETSLNIEGDIKDQLIAPLLLLPFLENAFKHGTSEQLERPWLSIDISVRQHTLRCKIANSKNVDVPVSRHGIGIQNVKKRLGFLYSGKHELKLADEGEFFVVSLVIELINIKVAAAATAATTLYDEKTAL